MLYYSLNKQSPKVKFDQATIRGQAPDKGLYFPESIPNFPAGLIKEISKYSKEEIALQVIKPFVGDTIPEAELRKIVEETVNFDFPLVQVNDSISSLELFHGPTLAFKDVGARFMSRCLGHFVRNNDRKVTVLVATSGDTGGAVANGFYNVEGVDVIILYPSGKVSSIQELQLTALGQNVTALEVDGNFDDCQNLVKQAFADSSLTKDHFLTSANSINVARWLPQQFYYLFAYQQWKDPANPPVICVPSGNFGNICAGLLAHRSGLPVKQFIAACNANDTVSGYLETGNYHPKTAVATISNAMDVGHPSNFVRVLELFDQQFITVKNILKSYTVTDGETRDTLKKVFDKENYLLDPHGAVAYKALSLYLEKFPGQKGIILETAHPVKFYDVVEPLINQTIPIPATVQSLLTEKKKSIKMEVDYKQLASIIRSK